MTSSMERSTSNESTSPMTSIVPETVSPTEMVVAPELGWSSCQCHLSPSCPLSFAPEQAIESSSRMAQMWSAVEPEDSWTTDLPSGMERVIESL